MTLPPSSQSRGEPPQQEPDDAPATAAAATALPPAAEGTARRIMLRPVPGSAVRAGVRCGVFAAAATAGAMVGFAWREGGGLLAPFFATGRMLLGVAAGEGRSAQLLALVGGAALHVALVVAWGVLFSLLAGALRGARLWIAAAFFSAAVYWASDLLLPSLLQLGHGTRAFPPQLVVLHAVLALGLALGMRLAFLSGTREAHATTSLRV